MRLDETGEQIRQQTIFCTDIDENVSSADVGTEEMLETFDALSNKPPINFAPDHISDT